MIRGRPTLRLGIASAVALGACGTQNGDVDTLVVPARRGTVVAYDTCALSATQTDALSQSVTQQLVADVVLDCLNVDPEGNVTTFDGTSTDALQTQIAALQAMGSHYHVNLAFTLYDPTTSMQAVGAVASAMVSSVTWQTATVNALASYAVRPDGFEIALPSYVTYEPSSVDTFVASLGRALRPAHTLAMWLPPAGTSGGSSYELETLSTLLDRAHVMTLDFSGSDPADGTSAGPTIDSGWAIDSANAAAASLGSLPFDIAVPLYGYDFGTEVDTVSYADATSLASGLDMPPTRTIGGELTFTYFDAASAQHDVWYSDALSTRRVLAAWQTSSLPANVGVVYFGLGDEDPATWQTIATAESPQ